MNRKMLTRIASTSLMLGLTTIACTPHATGVSTASAKPTKAQDMAARQAGKAREALARNKGKAAVAAAENAVALAPQDAAYRMLLGQAYLTAGRFASAETSFRDALSLNPNLPKARFNLGLTQVARGDTAAAQMTLHGLDGAIPATDLGLALALAGDHDGGIQMLVGAARQQDATVRTRQNLALAYALNGQWRESRAVAMQDTTPDRINDQIAEWATLASPQATSERVAAMLGVKASPDAGLPTRLALTAPAADAASVAVAAADPAPATAAAAPAPAAADAGVAMPLGDPVPATPVLASQNDESSVAVPLDAPQPTTPVMLAAEQVEPPHRMSVPALIRTAKGPVRVAGRGVAPMTPVSDAAPKLVKTAYKADFKSGGYVVQLGAFARAGAVETAWGKVAHQSPQLASYAPARGQYRLSGAALQRLSIAGFRTRDAALKVCDQVKAKGGQCFVRAEAGDAPLEWVRRDTGTQVASR